MEVLPLEQPHIKGVPPSSFELTKGCTGKESRKARYSACVREEIGYHTHCTSKKKKKKKRKKEEERGEERRGEEKNSKSGLLRTLGVIVEPHELGLGSKCLGRRALRGLLTAHAQVLKVSGNRKKVGKGPERNDREETLLCVHISRDVFTIENGRLKVRDTWVEGLTGTNEIFQWLMSGGRVRACEEKKKWGGDLVQGK